MTDAVDAVIASWSAERPDLDFWPVGVVGRIQRLSRHFDRAIQEFSAAHGLGQGEVDVLMTLRRAGDPYELSASALLKAAMVTSGAITNRVDRMERKDLVERVRDPGTGARSDQAHSARAHLVDDLITEHLANEVRLLRGSAPRARRRACRPSARAARVPG